MVQPMTIAKNGRSEVPMGAVAGAVVKSITPGEIMEQVLIKGDLKNMSEAERARYYTRVCESVGLNPLTRPLEYITLNGKLTLYARKDCTDQLRKLNGISVDEITVEQLGSDIYVFVAKLSDKSGRKDVARGAVNIAGLKGEALANQIMKGETKAKRRGTLSMAGMGFLDETEIEDVSPEPRTRKSSAGAKRDGTNDTFNEIRRQIASAPECETLQQIADSYAQDLANLPVRWSLMISQEFEDKWRDLGGSLEDSPVRAGEEPG
jgi:hypothetical protein